MELLEEILMLQKPLTKNRRKLAAFQKRLV